MESFFAIDKLFGALFIIIGIFFFLLSKGSKQYESWVQNFGEKSAKTIVKFMRYVAPPICICVGIVFFYLTE